MNDMSLVIEPKSDQLNADDLIAGPITVTIRDVKITPGGEQPVSIFVEGTDKAYRPCKSMSRVLVQGWGADAKRYIGRSLTLYRDPTVKWAGIEVGGIRISHMSDIDGAKHMMLTATRGSRKPHKVLPLVMQPTTDDPAERWANGFIAKLATLESAGAIEDFELEKTAKLAELQGARPELYEKVIAAVGARKAQLAPANEPAATSSAAGFDDDDFSSAPVAAQPETLLDAVDQGAVAQPGADPAAAKCNELIAEIKAAESIAEVTAIWGRNSGHVEVMDEGLRAALVQVKDARLSELRAAPANQEAAQ